MAYKADFYCTELCSLGNKQHSAETKWNEQIFFIKKFSKKGWDFSLQSRYPAGTETARGKQQESKRPLQPNRPTLIAVIQKIIPNSSENFLLLKFIPIYHIQKTNSELGL